MSTNASDLIAGALRLISSATPGESLNGDEAGTALIALNDLLASWSAQSFMVPFRTIESFPLVAGQQSYTIGSGANFNTTRPDSIGDCYLHDTVSGLDYPMESMTNDQYNAITLKTIQGIPKWFYYDPQYPSGVLYLYPTSSLASYSVYIDSLKPVAQFSSLSATLALPGEYQRPIKLLLAENLSIEYGFPLDQTLSSQIADAKKMIRSKNAQRVVASFDPALSSRPLFNIKTGGAW